MHGSAVGGVFMTFVFLGLFQRFRIECLVEVVILVLGGLGYETN